MTIAPPLSAFLMTMDSSLARSEMHLRSTGVVLVRFVRVNGFCNNPSSLVAIICSRLGGPRGGVQLDSDFILSDWMSS